MIFLMLIEEFLSIATGVEEYCANAVMRNTSKDAMIYQPVTQRH